MMDGQMTPAKLQSQMVPKKMPTSLMPTAVMGAGAGKKPKHQTITKPIATLRKYLASYFTSFLAIKTHPFYLESSPGTYVNACAKPGRRSFRPFR